MLKFNCLLGILLFASAVLAQKPGITTEHGYQFFLHVDKGGPKPKRGETVKAYVNVFIGDTLLSSSRKNLGGTYKYDIPAQDASLDHYPPIMDAVLLMGLGDSATIYQAVDSSMRKFLPKGTENLKSLRFEIALAQIITAEEKAMADRAFAQRAEQVKQQAVQKAKDFGAGKLDGQLTPTGSGLQMLVLEKGGGNAVKKGVPVQVHYYGMLKDGSIFDNSFERRHPLAFPAGVGQMIPGFDEGIMLLNRGAKAFLFIPSKLGYGDSEAAGGKIPPNSDLIFYIEVL